MTEKINRDSIVEISKKGLMQVEKTYTGAHLKTGDIRKLSAELFRGIDDKSKNNVIGSTASCSSDANRRRAKVLSCYPADEVFNSDHTRR